MPEDFLFLIFLILTTGIVGLIIWILSKIKN